MFLSLAVLSLSIAVFLFSATAIANRRRKWSLLTNETMVSCVVMPLIITLAAMGVAGIIQCLMPGKHPSPVDMAVAGAILAVAASLFALLGLGRKMRQPDDADTRSGKQGLDSSGPERGSGQGPVGGSPPVETPA